MAVRGFLGLVLEDFWEGASDPNPRRPQSCHAQAARPSVPSEPAEQPLDRADWLARAGQQLSPLGAVAISHAPHVPGLACECTSMTCLF